MGVLAQQACMTPAPVAPPPAVDPIAQRIDQGLAKASSLQEFTRGADRAASAPTPAVDRATVTVSFHGDAAQLLRGVAAARGKELRVRGPLPHLPLIVQVNAVGLAYEEFLKDVGYQFGQRADLVLSDGHIEIRYRGAP
jgi:defect-in-organelle-trafficking protein DotD